ncbi:MAG: hypothetical protein QM761_01780 [Pseudoxanthomonas sp.]
MAQVQQRSTFVTVLAWIFIVLSGFSTVISILQNIMIFTVFRSPEISQAMQAPPPSDMPPAAAFMTSHFHLFFLAFLLASAFTLTSSIGLLKRWNWARLCFVGIMGLGILWNLGGLVLQFSMFSSMQDQFSAAASHGGPNMQPFFIAIAVVSALFAVGFSVLFGWIARRLLSPAIAAEFRR